MLLLHSCQLNIVLRDRGEDLIKLILVVLGHVLKVLVERAAVLNHPLDFEFDLGVDCNSLLVGDHLLVHLMAQFRKLFCELVSFSLGIFQSSLKFRTT